MINTCLLNLQVTDPMNISEPDSSFAFIREFILLGFSYEWKIQSLLFSLFLTIYALTITGNGAIICALWHDQRLHIPMYIFLGNFSFLEIWYVSSTVPKMLVNFLSDKKTISFVGCFLQFYFFFSLGTTECLLLAVMAFDRYLAICRPLHYPNIMTGHLCTKLVLICWVCGFLWFLIPIVLISRMPFCGPNIIDHVVCDPGPLFALACVSAPQTQLLCYSLSSIVIFGNFLFILGSYTLVLTAVLHVFNDWETESLLHLWVSSGCGIPVLWLSDGHVCEPRAWTFCWDAESCNFVLCYGDPTLQSLYL